MNADGWALVISGVGVLTGLVTLSFVLRNEFRARREQPPVAWGFHRFGTADVDGVKCEVAELVQYGRMPTRMLNYTPVGFNLHLQHGYRVRAFVKSEDTMPLFLTDVDEDNAWLLILHTPRDDRRFVYVDSVDLDPTSDSYRDKVDAALQRIKKEHSGFGGRVRTLKWRVTRGSIVRPVGPEGYGWARLRVDGKRKWFAERDMDTILSLATAEGATSFTPY